MASHDYYSSFDPHRTHDTAPQLPPIPTTSSSSAQHYPYHQSDSQIAPVTSPFDDHTYPSNSIQPSQTSLGTTDSAYHGAAGVAGGNSGMNSNDRLYHQQSDPFTDHSAIPLQDQHNSMDGKNGFVAHNEDLENPNRRRKHKKSRRPRQPVKKRTAWAVWIFTAVQVGVFIGELIKSSMLTGSPIATKPSFNPMIGPSPYVLINMGARFAPCMHNVRGITDYPNPIGWLCPNATSIDDSTCSLSQACGLGGVPEQKPGTSITDRTNEPNQWFRFIIPMFLHGGIIHIIFNMLLQVTLGRDIEQQIGTLRFVLVYFSSGIFGFVLGGNYAAPLIASTGASGALFGILALTLLDLLYTWQDRRSPIRDLLFILLEIAIAFILGLLPGLDNFSHIGGFLMGLVLGVCILHSPNALRQRTGQDEPPYSAVTDANGAAKTGVQGFVRQPLGFFKGRKPLWWVWWIFRAAALVVVLIGFILLLNNFYVGRKECSWCKHLTCLDINNWCKIGLPNLPPPNSTTPA